MTPGESALLNQINLSVAAMREDIKEFSNSFNVEMGISNLKLTEQIVRIDAVERYVNDAKTKVIELEKRAVGIKDIADADRRRVYSTGAMQIATNAFMMFCGWLAAHFGILGQQK